MSFHAVDWYEIHEQPVAHITSNPYLPELWDPGQLKNETVEIDGQMYEVKAVEKFMIMISPSQPYQLSFGLLVDQAAR